MVLNLPLMKCRSESVSTGVSSLSTDAIETEHGSAVSEACKPKWRGKKLGAAPGPPEVLLETAEEKAQEYIKHNLNVSLVVH